VLGGTVVHGVTNMPGEDNCLWGGELVGEPPGGKTGRVGGEEKRGHRGGGGRVPFRKVGECLEGRKHRRKKKTSQTLRGVLKKKKKRKTTNGEPQLEEKRALRLENFETGGSSVRERAGAQNHGSGGVISRGNERRRGKNSKGGGAVERRRKKIRQEV